MWKCLMFVPALLVASAAMAQDTATVFAALDADRNGSVSQAEAQKNAAVSANFAAADTNSDGSLSRAEFDAAFG